MTAHTSALARLNGAAEAHTLSPATVALIETILRRHPDNCAGVRHIQGRAECEFYRAALVVLGIREAA